MTTATTRSVEIKIAPSQPQRPPQKPRRPAAQNTGGVNYIEQLMQQVATKKSRLPTEGVATTAGVSVPDVINAYAEAEIAMQFDPHVFSHDTQAVAYVVERLGIFHYRSASGLVWILLEATDPDYFLVTLGQKLGQYGSESYDAFELMREVFLHTDVLATYKTESEALSALEAHTRKIPPVPEAVIRAGLCLVQHGEAMIDQGLLALRESLHMGVPEGILADRIESELTRKPNEHDVALLHSRTHGYLGGHAGCECI